MRHKENVMATTPRLSQKFVLVSALFSLLILSGCRFEPETGQPIHFGEVYVGMASEVRTARWINNGEEDVILDTAITRPPFSIANPVAFASSATIASQGGTSATVQMTFTPTEAGAVNGRIRPVTSDGSTVQKVPIQMNGTGVWAKSAGSFVLENRPPQPIGSTLVTGSTPIQPNQPIDFGTMHIGDTPREAEFRVANSGGEVQHTAHLQLLKGSEGFAITIPTFELHRLHIPENGSPFGGHRNITVTFTPTQEGDFLDVVQVTDSANPASLAGIVLKARVEAGE